ncbi:MAG: signal peptidase [Enterovirga sp.]|nr:signal peptidase [Enterovirga sp.]
MSPRRLGYATAFTVLVADQATKLLLLFAYDLSVKEPLTLGPFLDLIVVWNRGISYGLFQQHSELGRGILIGVSFLAAAGLLVWIARSGRRLLAMSLGLLCGGAVGNAIDRVAYGAVFDFVHLHVGQYSWYVFNVADVAIVAGVVGLLYDSLVIDRAKPDRDDDLTAKPS